MKPIPIAMTTSVKYNMPAATTGAPNHLGTGAEKINTFKMNDKDTAIHAARTGGANF